MTLAQSQSFGPAIKQENRPEENHKSRSAV